MNELALFAGAGGGILGGKLLGWTTICAVEWEPYAAAVLCARQNEGFLAPFPIWDDVRTFDGRPWRGRVDVVSGGFPCQDISAAGKGAGIDGERSGLWREMARIICEVRPRFCFVENSPMLISRGLGTVLGDLAALGYDCKWGVFGASEVGAPHKRERIWIAACCARPDQTRPDQKWPTPTTSMAKGTSMKTLTRKTGKSRRNDRLDHAVLFRQTIPTPNANEDSYRLNGLTQQSNSLGAMARREAIAGGTNGQLNPTWVEWLMGWPLGWTDLKPLATARFQQWQHLHGASSQENNPNADAP